ncbi:hypothetical protein [Microbacterium kunmingense]|uniref:hypothetical protein n=1 Tax=Microbacterium kunmingense TaxID=2915939 RepID=UPI0020065FFB|nr:hypothetical protein [Microbacterium kunmingense]
MNRYAAVGINQDAELGKRIIVLTVTTTESRAALEEIAALAPAEASARRANGLESIRYPSGGRVTIRSHRQGTRGHSADVLYLDGGVDAQVRDTAAWDSLRATLAASPHAEIIRA